MLARSIALGAVAVLLLAVVSHAQDSTHADRSQGVAAAVEDLLSRDPLAELDNVDAIVNEGRVTLHGTVPSLMAKERAARIARTVIGVKDVTNEIAIRPRVTLSAGELRSAVRNALVANPATEAYQLQFAAERDGSISLRGSVESWAERDAAEHVAKGISGVTAVRNDIEVDYATDRPDSEISADIERLLHWDAYLGDSKINVSVRNGAVSLTGAVATSAEKSHASRLAWIAGTKSVDVESLKVVGDGATLGARKQPEAGTSDKEIAAAVQSRLELSASVSGPVDVQVERGIATLRGELDTLSAKRKAAALASQVVGVERVEDKLRITSTSPGPSDGKLAARVAAALQGNPITDAYEIEVDVRRGVVDLSGNVGSWIEKGTAEDLVAAIRGVRDINNRLQILDYARARRATSLESLCTRMDSIRCFHPV